MDLDIINEALNIKFTTNLVNLHHLWTQPNLSLYEILFQ
jgi:hypothetical protein